MLEWRRKGPFAAFSTTPASCMTAPRRMAMAELAFIGGISTAC
jgi:hypothetical protein